ncbi:hypothetical protein NDU88_000626 [Pleurodeles waltl]|uniref:Uncharacterized protein n=1 Tax=Pleurodeles waltl TaxID=8319 RepID=A0AAV7KR93_PLEWA|nr:hypothetical protein NDU88_000626 [Pleurodeles waltl]
MVVGGNFVDGDDNSIVDDGVVDRGFIDDEVVSGRFVSENDLLITLVNGGIGDGRGITAIVALVDSNTFVDGGLVVILQDTMDLIIGDVAVGKVGVMVIDVVEKTVIDGEGIFELFNFYQELFLL